MGFGIPKNKIKKNIYCLCRKVASEMGRRLGEVVEVENRKAKEGQNLFMRVKVAAAI